MKVYNLIFGTDLRNRNKLEYSEKFKYYDINDKKTVANIKDFVTCFNDSLCTCMLKLYLDNNQRFPGEKEDKILLRKISQISQEGNIYIGQIERECKCNFLRLNKDLISKVIVSSVGNSATLLILFLLHLFYLDVTYNETVIDIASGFLFDLNCHFI